MKSRSDRDAATDKFSFGEYHDVDTIYSRLDELASDNSSSAEVGILGMHTEWWFVDSAEVGILGMYTE